MAPPGEQSLQLTANLANTSRVCCAGAKSPLSTVSNNALSFSCKPQAQSCAWLQLTSMRAQRIAASSPCNALACLCKVTERARCFVRRDRMASCSRVASMSLSVVLTATSLARISFRNTNCASRSAALGLDPRIRQDVEVVRLAALADREAHGVATRDHHRPVGAVDRLQVIAEHVGAPGKRRFHRNRLTPALDGTRS